MLQEQSSGAYLVIQRGPLVGKRVELWKDCTTIGRSRDRDIFLEDITVHRKQASIIRTPHGFVLRDDNGSGDSLVNGKPVQEQLLNSGDQLLLGNTQLVFYANEGTRPFQLASSRGRELRLGKTQSSPPASFILLGPNGSTRTIELLPEMTIGRSRDCNIFLEDLAVSRLHTTVRELPSGDYELEDHGSATGTFVNDRPVSRWVLRNDDIVQIGGSKFLFRLAPPQK